MARALPAPASGRVAFFPDIRVAVGLACALATAACQGCGPAEPAWALVMQDLPGAVVSVWGTSATDVYVVGGPGAGAEPTVLHYDGTAWTSLDPGVGQQVFWWVFGFEGGPVYMAGSGGIISRYDPAAGTFATETTPGGDTIFGVWGSAPGDVWAVGGNVAGGPGQQFVWHSDGSGAWTDESAALPAMADTTALFKVWGSAADDVWAVGAAGVAVHFDGTDWTWTDTGTTRTLFTVHTDGPRAVGVGGFGNGLWTEWDGTAWTATTPTAAPQFNGVWLTPATDWIVGATGAIWSRPGGPGAVGTPFAAIDEEPLTGEDFHAVWVDPSGGVWAVGGALNSPTFDRGVVAHLGETVIPGL